MKNNKVFDPVEVDAELDDDEEDEDEEDEVEGLASSGTLNFPASKPRADNTIKTTIAIKIIPIRHMRNLSV